MFKTVESQYEILFDTVKKHGVSEFGLMANESWNQDPRRTLFTLARYKFVAKMFVGKSYVLEVGCADAFGTRLVQQEVANLTAIDIDPVFVADVEKRMNPHWPMEVFQHDMLVGPIAKAFDAVYALDVIEHIHPSSETQFIKNICRSMHPDGVAIFGAPSLESQIYASPQSSAGHVNCKSGIEFRRGFESFFRNVFLFSMNDEVVHTGFYPMSHYLLALCCGVKEN